jgi:GrpB-like predicted nucleotidyltransferase (UPF0157 family)
MSYNKYKFRRYNKNFPKLYQKEKKKLQSFLPREVIIEHIGSTSVSGLGGKGVIDIMIGAKKNIEIIKDKLIEENYIFKPAAGEKNRLFLEKDYRINGKIQRVHIQLTKYKSKIWNDCIKVRNLLKINKKLAEKYSKIKREAVRFSKGDGKKYREYKNKFLKDLIKLT